MTSRPRRTAAHLPRQVGPDRGPVPCLCPPTSVVHCRGNWSSPFDYMSITLKRLLSFQDYPLSDSDGEQARGVVNIHHPAPGPDQAGASSGDSAEEDDPHQR
jgi:hypothetical protein